MTEKLSKEELHDRFIAALAPSTFISSSTDSAGELVMELRSPLPNRVRVYIYNATNPPGGRSSPEYKIQPSLSGQKKDGDRRNFDWSGVDFVLLCGYVREHDIFVFWDASLHTNFTHSKNIQVRTENILGAAEGSVITRQDRLLQTGPEVVISAPRQLVPVAIAERASIRDFESQEAGRSATQGQPYMRPTRRDTAQSKLRVFNVDPDAIDRGTNAHKEVQDQLADAVSARGWQPLSPSDSDPLFDIAWIAGKAAWIVEVKSLTEANEDRQLRLGLGQVLSYAYLVDWDVSENRPVLAVEREPSSSYWADLCTSHGVVLSWPEIFDELLDSCV